MMIDTKKDKKKDKGTTKNSSMGSSSQKQISSANASDLRSLLKDTEEGTSRREYAFFFTGLFLSLFAFFSILSIISYAFTGWEDFNYVNKGTEAGNIMGELGAHMAYFFVKTKFGYASVFLCAFLLVLGLRFMFTTFVPDRKNQGKSKKNKKMDASKLVPDRETTTPFLKIRLWKWFINCGILTLWFTCFLASIKNLLGGPLPGAGGETGDALYELMYSKVGPFTYAILFAVAIAYLCYLSNETIHIIRRFVSKPVEIIQDKLSTHGQTSEEADANSAVNEESLTEEEANRTDMSDVGVDEANTKSQISIKGESEQDPYSETLVTQDIDNSECIDFLNPNKSIEQPATQSHGIDTHTATTIVFNVEDEVEGKVSSSNAPNLDLLDTQEFEVTIGADKETNEVRTQESNKPTNDITSHQPSSPELVLTLGQANEVAAPDALGALEPYDPKLDLENYRYPTLDLLKKYEIDMRTIDMEEQNKNKNQIITALRNFGVEISSIKATVGPTITLYEITPAPGVRISKIRNLEDDIALSLSALGIRIIAPIPGKGTIGIEVPNAKPQIVSMESVINSKRFQESDMELPMALGKTITNEIFIADLAKMPHLLVAGATGQGKSVGLNAILTSLLYKKHPAELKLVMVDPKKVEFSIYNPLVNHFLAQVEGNEDTEEPIITDVDKVVQTLKSLCLEMDTRYDLLKKARARNLKEYNEKFKSRQLNPNNGHKFMPYIVVIIDEFGDLIMTAGKEIELPIARIAQLARAVGIHMIIATQRPTTNIITGTIKANFPARIAFKVSSMIDSRTILDRPGANQLVGKGDMLFLAGNEPVRVQCAFVDTPEVERINTHIACQQSYNAPFPLPFVEMEGENGDTPDVDMNHLDPMFEEVARLIVSTQQGSTSMIQRKFSIGYNRAGRLMDQLEVAGIVGPAHGSKPREVLCPTESELQFRLDNIRS